jgi:O-antigen ligase
VVLLEDERSLRAPSLAGAGRHGLLLTAAWTMSGIIVYLLAPRAAPGLLPLCVVAPLLWHWGQMRRIRWHRPAPALIVLALAALYLLINCTWSLSPSSAYSEVACLLAFIAVLYVTLSMLQETETPVLRAMAVGFIAAMLLGGAFLAFEAFSQQAAHRLLMSLAPSWGPAPRHMRMEAGSVAFLEPYLLDRSMTGLVLLLSPAALAIDRLRLARRRQTLLMLGLLLAVAAIVRSEHATSKLALVGATATYGMFLLSPKLTRRLAIAGWIATTLLVVPMASLAYSQELYLAGWLTGSARQRIVIWGYTSEQVAKAPWLGAGVSTARAISTDIKADPEAPRAPGSKYRLTPAWHSHNGYLQTWYEAGAVGALFLIAFGLLLLRSLARAPAAAQPYLYATFAAGALLAGSSFSLWAPWFVASLALSCVLAALGSEQAGHPPP